MSASPEGMKRAKGALAALTVMLPALAIIGLEHASHGALLAGYLLSFLPYLCVVYALHRAPASRALFFMIVGSALLMRLVLVCVEPVWSDDIYRYVWDGRVAYAGINPFMYAPDAVELLALRDGTIWPLINHKHISTIYPPVAQGVFHVNAWLGGGTILLRALFIFLECLMIFLAWCILRHTPWCKERGVFALALYALNPVVCVELAWSGHLDVLAYGPLTLAVLWWTQGGATRGWRETCVSAAWLGVSVAAKMLPVIVLPLWIFSPRGGQSWRQVIVRRAAVVGVVMTIAVGSYVPYRDAGSQLFAGFGTYATKWRGNDGAFRGLMTLSEESFRAWTPDEMRADRSDPDSKAFATLGGLEQVFLDRGLTREWEGRVIANNTFAEDQIAQTVAKLIVAALMGLVLLWGLLVTRDVRVSVLMLLMCLFFLAPTVYPWYVAWLVPLGAVQRRVWVTPVVFGATSLTAYVAILVFERTGEWAVPWWGVGAGAVCVAVALVWDIRGARRAAE